ncbi:UNVERIFIED_CONTAM: hypothetical protein ABID98_000178 [Brevibacillus sp. OAP136]
MSGLIGWNYRVLKHGEGNNAYFEVSEVYYDENNEPVSWIEGKNPFVQDSVEDMEHVIELIKLGLSKPVLKVVGDKLIDNK